MQPQSVVISCTTDKQCNESEKEFSKEYKTKRTHTKSISVEKGSMTIAMPCTHDIVTKSRLSVLENKARLMNNLQKYMSRHHYLGTPLGNRLIGSPVAMVPQAGVSGVATITPLIVASLLTNAGIPFNNKNLV